MRYWKAGAIARHRTGLQFTDFFGAEGVFEQQRIAGRCHNAGQIDQIARNGQPLVAVAGEVAVAVVAEGAGDLEAFELGFMMLAALSYLWEVLLRPAMGSGLKHTLYLFSKDLSKFGIIIGIHLLGKKKMIFLCLSVIKSNIFYNLIIKGKFESIPRYFWPLMPSFCMPNKPFFIKFQNYSIGIFPFVIYSHFFISD
jgi:hypothetical protein